MDNDSMPLALTADDLDAVDAALMSLETSMLILEVQTGDNSFEIDLSKFAD